MFKHLTTYNWFTLGIMITIILIGFLGYELGSTIAIVCQGLAVILQMRNHA